jgi:hypothetical protein
MLNENDVCLSAYRGGGVTFVMLVSDWGVVWLHQTHPVHHDDQISKECM